MKKKTSLGLDELIAWRERTADMVCTLIEQHHVPDIPKGMALELAVEAVEEALHRLWEERRGLGIGSIGVPEACEQLKPASDVKAKQYPHKRRVAASTKHRGKDAAQAADEAAGVEPMQTDTNVSLENET